MYQFERSSTNASKARMTSTVSDLSYASAASATNACVRSTSQRSSGGELPAGPPASPRGAASKPSMFA